MQMRGFIFGTAVLLCAVTVVALADRGAGPVSADTRPQALLALRQLQSDFHGAATVGDYELMRSLWAADAVVFAGGGTHVGPTEIADFFSSGPNWGRSASLSPTYTSSFDIQGNTAMLQFECVIVNTGDLDPVATPLSTIPFGARNPDVEIVQHSTATCVAVRESGRWVLQMFVGSAGPAASAP